ncbi:MAG TPA: SWIM zinc finger family protein [Coleofasciculaceae cyanobacterium]
MTDFERDPAGRSFSQTLNQNPGQEKDASIERAWWVERWLDLLNSYRFKKRLERARDYARQGNVLSIEFRSAKVLARVQGTEAEPYRVSLAIDPFTDEDWAAVAETLAQQAGFAAKLLAGEMPQSIERVFGTNGLSLFPFALGDIHSQCTCPDQANPCKHIGAVYYLLGDRFSDDPFVLFQLRGRTRQQLLEALREVRSRLVSEAPAEPIADAVDLEPIDAQTVIAPPIVPVDMQQFWAYDQPLESSLVVITPPADGSTPLDLLGPVPLPSDGTTDNRSTQKVVTQHLEDVYRAAGQAATVAALS